MAGHIATLLAGPSAKIEGPEIRGRFGGDSRVEIQHGPIGSRISADHAVRIVTRCAANAAVIAVGCFATDSGQVVALIAQVAGVGAASTPTAARRFLKQIELQEVWKRRTVRPVRAGAVGGPGLIVIVAISAVDGG